MTEANQNLTAALLGMLSGLRVAQAISVCARLRLADYIGSEPVSAASVAAKAGSHEESTFRLLRAIARLGIFDEHADRRFSANAMSDLLRTGTPGSIQPWAEFVGGPGHWRYWGDLAHAVRTGEDAPRHLDGASIWDVRAKDASLNALFNAAMASLSGATIPAIVAGFDFSRFKRIVDLGGGDGTLLAGILRANPTVTGVLFDLPHVASAAAANFNAPDIAARAQVMSGSYLTDPLPSEADAFVIKSVLTDSDDAEARFILSRVRDVISPDGRIVVVDGVVPTQGWGSCCGSLRPEHAGCNGRKG
jgi:hypothetical protein